MLDGPFIESTILLAYLNLISFRRRTISRIHYLSCCLCLSCQHHNSVFVFYAQKIGQGHVTYFPHEKRVQLLNSLRDVLERLSCGTNIGKIKRTRKTSNLVN